MCLVAQSALPEHPFAALLATASRRMDVPMMFAGNGDLSVGHITGLRLLAIRRRPTNSKAIPQLSQGQFHH